MKVSCYSVKIFGYGLYLLYCFRISSLTVEGRRNLFMHIARKIWDADCFTLLWVRLGTLRETYRIFFFLLIYAMFKWILLQLGVTTCCIERSNDGRSCGNCLFYVNKLRCVRFLKPLNIPDFKSEVILLIGMSYIKGKFWWWQSGCQVTVYPKITWFFFSLAY